MTPTTFTPLVRRPPSSTTPEATLQAGIERLRQLGAAVSWDSPLGHEIVDLAGALLEQLETSLVLVTPLPATAPAQPVWSGAAIAA